MPDIIKNSLDSKLEDIVRLLAIGYGYSSDLNGLTEEKRFNIRHAADQAILNWAFARANGRARPVPVTNLQHLLDDYCAIADHL